MEEYQKSMEKARKNLQVADHMTYVTYKVVKEPRILLSILENIFLSFTNAMAALLHFERMYKRVPMFSDTFESKYNLYRRIESKKGLDRSFSDTLNELKRLIVAHKKSPMEFRRDDRFVICSEDYRMKTITITDIKRYLAKAKLFIEEIEAKIG